MSPTHTFSTHPKTLLALVALAVPLSAAELLHQEGFNTDGSIANPPRYTFIGKDIYEVDRIQSELGNYDQKGPLYWAHNFEVSFVGNPNIPGRRAIFTWKSTDPFAGLATPDLLELWEATVDWLTTNKANATIVVYPDVNAIGELAAHLTAQGHNVVSDDPAILDEQDVPGDLFIHAGTANPSRFAMLAKPVIVMSEPDYDDMLVGSIGAAATFAPGQITISSPTHPAAGGKTGSFAGWVDGVPEQAFGLTGSFLAPGATTIATVTRTIPPAINNLADVDAVIAGTKQHEMTEGTVSDIDFSDGSGGNWFMDNPIPGGYAGNWGLRVTGQINVAAAGTYRFALGSDDGARLMIDADRNGITDADTVLTDTGPHAHQIVYADVTFPASGNYPFEIRSYNSGAGGSLEFSASIQTVPIPDDTLESGYWEHLSENGFGPIKLQGPANVTAYIAAGASVQQETPLAVVLNGPNDNPPGSFYDGGPLTGFEGAGFIGASGLNKWTYPPEGNYRAVQLPPVNVAGKTNVQLTIKLAATGVDFETDDYIEIFIYTNGVSGSPISLARFRGVQNAVQPWLADERANFVRRLTKQFTDFTYNIPPQATDLVVEIRAATTWWTEIAAFDDIRITAGATGGGGGDPTISIAKQGASAVITFANGTLQRATSLTTPIQWTDVNATGGTHTVTSAEQAAGAFFRAIRR